MALAGFTIGEAEGLRRAMSRKRSEEAIEAFRQRFIEGAARNGVDAEAADLVYDKLAAFSGFGFPKSHAAAFGLLALPVRMAAPPLSGRVPLLAPERPADGLLPAVESGAGCPAARRGGAAAGREPERCRLHPRRGRGAAGALLREVGGNRRCGGARRRARRERPVCRRRGSRPPRAARCARARSAPPQRCLRLLGEAARPALGARARDPSEDRSAARTSS